MKWFISLFNPRLPLVLTYMLQQVEYSPHKFLAWALRLPNFSTVMQRQDLVLTAKAKLLIIYIYLIWIWYLSVGLLIGATNPFMGLSVLVLSPFIVIIILYLTVLVAWLWIEEPRRNKELKNANKKFKNHPGFKIAILGSYGKTTMKELLSSVLAEHKFAAATPGNKNVPISHARWINRLSGDEEVLLIEYGEGSSGDIKKLAELTHPNAAIITGLAPNHLDSYKSIDALAKDFLSITDYVSPSNTYITGDGSLEGYDTDGLQTYDQKKVLGWKISNIKIEHDKTSFVMSRSKRKIHIKSGLIGRHQVPVIALVAAIDSKLGMSAAQIEKAFVNTKPFEHRMQPRRQHGAWIIDDTYNGNAQGIKAGLALLAELPAKRKVYVTPGLVDQGQETKRVHREIGVDIAKANPDQVVLMMNTTTDDIHHGLTAAGYGGHIEFVDDPLRFYTNLEHRLAGGDLWLLQNDWTDNYK